MGLFLLNGSEIDLLKPLLTTSPLLSSVIYIFSHRCLLPIVHLGDDGLSGVLTSRRRFRGIRACAYGSVNDRSLRASHGAGWMSARRRRTKSGHEKERQGLCVEKRSRKSALHVIVYCMGHGLSFFAGRCCTPDLLLRSRKSFRQLLVM